MRQRIGELTTLTAVPYTITGTGLANVLTSIAQPPGLYRFEAHGTYNRTDAVASTVSFGIATTSTAVSCSYTAVLPTTGTTVQVIGAIAFSTALATGSEAANGTVRSFWLSGMCQISTAGTISLAAARSSLARINAASLIVERV